MTQNEIDTYHFITRLLQDEGLEYAHFDTQQRLTAASAGLSGSLLAPPTGDLSGEKMAHLFPELIGYDQSLQDLRDGTLPELKIERIYRAALNGEEGYITLRLSAVPNGFLLIARDATTEGRLEQKVTQQRNELSLLSGQLSQAQARLDALLRQFVPSAVVDDMLSDRRKTELGGQRKEITVLFADLRGFTGWSENHEPEKVMDVLNNALGEAVKILLEAGATLDKFMGDALMAIFNAPVEQPDHANRALACARQISLAQHAVPGLQFGIGVNTGVAVVGNIGTQQAMNYTVLGDAVNIAKRLEEISTAGQVLMGPNTHALAQPEFTRKAYGEIRLRGRQKTISAYELLI